MMIERIKGGLELWVHPAARFVNRLASVVLFLMMLLTITDVFLRKVFNRSIMGTVEVSEFMLVTLIFFTLAHTEVLDGHVKVDLIMGRFGRRAQNVVDMITQGICFILSGLITWSAVVYSGKMRAAGEVSQDLWLPIYPFIYIVALGCALLSLTLLIKFLTAFTKAVKS